MRKFYRCVLAIVLLCSCASVAAYAWTPSYSFYCEVRKDSIPNGTKYIDMLIPIAEKDKYYVSCNYDNSKLFNIPKDSEIVSYNDGGYKSYTFHISDAYSLMQPEVTYNFQISEEDYNAHKELLKPYDDHREIYFDSEKNEQRYVSDGGFIHYNTSVYLESKEYTEFWKVFSKVKPHNLSQTEASVDFNRDFFVKNHNFNYARRSVKCDYEYCRSTYKRVKFAYIDESGHILGVSNAISVYEKNIADPLLQLQLSGLTLTNHFEYSPQAESFRSFLLGSGVLFCGGIIIILVKVINARKKKKSRYPI
jgi:hypothetical protein